MNIYHTTKTIFGKDQRMPATIYISYPTLSASLTHCIHSASVSACFYVEARVSPCVFPLTRWNAHIFQATEASFSKLFCLFLCLLSIRFVCMTKIILFCKTVRQSKGIYNDFIGMINSLLGSLGCRIWIISSLGTSYTGSACGLTVYEFLD